MPTEPTDPRRNPVRETLEYIATKQGVHVSELPRSVRQDVIDAWRDRLTDLLETRVGEQISAHMTEAELDEFERLYDSGDEALTSAWLDLHAPSHPRIVGAELDLLVAEAGTHFSRSIESALIGGTR